MPTSLAAASLVIGLDGADLHLVQAMGAGRLPHLHRLMARGAYAAQRSVLPPATLPNWATFLTGMDPGQHGVFDFTLRQGYRVHFAGGSARRAPTLIARLDAAGKHCACLGFPGTWPPERLEHGWFLSGWDSPVAFEIDRSYVWPPSCFDELQRRFGPLRFDTVDELDADDDDWLTRLPQALCDRIESKLKLAQWVMQQRRWDLFAVYFGESDTAAHYLWALHDARSPRRPPQVSQAAEQGLARVYMALDQAVGELVAAAGGEQAEVTVVSDHGSGGSSDKVLYLNRALADAGLLHWRASTAGEELARWSKRHLLARVPRRLRDRVFAWQDRRLASAIESRARFGGIDFSRTRAFSDELNYFPAVHFNQRGREPQGIVAAADRQSLTHEVTAALRALRDPWSQRSVVAHVHRREELFDGPLLERAPDLLLELECDAGYSFNLMPSGNGPAGTGAWRRLASDEFGGRKGRSLPGSHRSQGLFIAAGPQVSQVGEIECHIADAAATMLARAGSVVPRECSGRVLWQLLKASQFASNANALPTPSMHAALPLTAAQETQVQARLRALGYVD